MGSILSFPRWDSGARRGKLGAEGRERAPSSPHQAVLVEVFDRYAEAIYRFAFRRLGNREDAQDVTAQVFLKAARSFDASFSEAEQRSWLFRAARTAIVDVWRSYGEVPVVSIEWYDGDWPEPEPPRDRDDGATRTHVQRLLEGLKPLHRQVLELRFLRGYTLAETARELGISEANAKVIQHRAVRLAAEKPVGTGHVDRSNEEQKDDDV